MFIVFEGPEGAGKSTQLQLLWEWFEQRGKTVRMVREPGGTPIGEELRRLVKHFPQKDGICSKTELLMFAAARAQVLESVIEPALARGEVVLCDRFIPSTIVYQGLCRGLSLEFIDQLHRFLLPRQIIDLVLVLDVPVELGFGRVRGRDVSHATDRIEQAGLEFHRAVRDGYHRLWDAYRSDHISLGCPCHQIDGTQPADMVHQAIVSYIASQEQTHDAARAKISPEN